MPRQSDETRIRTCYKSWHGRYLRQFQWGILLSSCLLPSKREDASRIWSNAQAACCIPLLNFILFGCLGINSVDVFAAGEPPQTGVGRRGALQRGGGGILSLLLIGPRVAPTAVDSAGRAAAEQIAALQEAVARLTAGNLQLSQSLTESIAAAARHANHGHIFSPEIEQSWARRFLAKNPDQISGGEFSDSFYPILEYLKNFWGSDSVDARERFIEVLSDWVKQKPNEAAPVLREVDELISGVKDYIPLPPSSGARQSILRNYRLAQLIHKVYLAVSSDPWKSFDWYKVFADRIGTQLQELMHRHNIPMEYIDKVIQLLAINDRGIVCDIPTRQINKYLSDNFLQDFAAGVRAFAPAMAEQFLKNFIFDRSRFEENLVEFTNKGGAHITTNMNREQPYDDVIKSIRYRWNERIGIKAGGNHISVNFLHDTGLDPRQGVSIYDHDEVEMWEEVFGYYNVPHSVLPLRVAFEKLNDVLHLLDTHLAELELLPDTSIRFALMSVGYTIRREVLFELLALPQKHRVYQNLFAKFKAFRHLDPGRQDWLTATFSEIPSPKSAEWLTFGISNPQVAAVDRRWQKFLSVRIPNIFADLDRQIGALVGHEFASPTAQIPNLTSQRAQTATTPVNLGAATSQSVSAFAYRAVDSTDAPPAIDEIVQLLESGEPVEDPVQAVGAVPRLCATLFDF